MLPGLCTDPMKTGQKTFSTCALSVTLIQTETLTPQAADLNSPFLPEFAGPGGLSVTDPAKGKNMYKAKTTTIPQELLKNT